MLGRGGGFDPAASTLAEQWQALAMTNDGLVAYRKAGGPAGLQVVPDLAAALPAVSTDGRTYTFLLRRGLRYSTGRPVRASDFRYAVERQFRTGANGYFQNVVFSSLLGYEACRRRPRACSLREAIRADDRTGTIRIRLRRSDPDLLAKLATPFGDLLPPGSPRADSGKPVPATGPYVVAAFVARTGFVLIRNPRFRPWSSDAQPAGFPRRIAWIRVADPEREIAAVESGRADVAADAPPADRLRELATRYVQFAHAYPGSATTYLSLNTRVAPFDDVRVRRALNFAVDRRRVVSFSGGPQVAAVTCQVLPSTIPGYAPYCPYTAGPGGAGVWSSPDLARARRLVAASGTRGMRVGLWARSTSNVAVARYLGRVLAQLGYRAHVHLAAYDRWNAELSDSRLHGQAGLGGWLPDYGRPAAFFDLLLTCRSFVPGSSANQNSAELCDRELDRLVGAAKSAQTSNTARAVVLWQRADRRAVDDAPWVPLTNDVGIDVVSSRTWNVQHNPEFGLLLDQLWVR